MGVVGRWRCDAGGRRHGATVVQCRCRSSVVLTTWWMTDTYVTVL